MQAYFSWAAVAMSLVTFAVHTFVGGPRVAAPLLANEHLPKASKWLSYYCWHVTTLYTLAMGAGYAYVALNPDRVELAVFLSLLNVALSVLSAAVATKGQINPFRFPSTSLFASVALLSLASLLFR